MTIETLNQHLITFKEKGFIRFKTQLKHKQGIAECFKTDKTRAARFLNSFKCAINLLICRLTLGLLLLFWRKSAAKFSRVFIKFKGTP